MTRSMAIMISIAAVSGSIGLTTLVRPAAARYVLGIADSEQATYALRIGGMMLFALGLFLGGFATIFTIAQGGG